MSVTMDHERNDGMSMNHREAIDRLNECREMYIPRKVLPWSSLSANGVELHADSMERSIGFVPVFGSVEELKAKFGDEVEVIIVRPFMGKRR